MARIVLVFCVVVTMSDATPFNIFQNTLNKIKQSINQVIGDKSTRADGKPWFCHELDCPEFKTVRKIEVKNDDGDDVTIEERCYPQTNWVKTSMDGSKDDDIVYRQTRTSNIPNKTVLRVLIILINDEQNTT